ncbi:RNA polymerase sigma factor [Effusibacillus consociatus]|uniref:RNA polymerase sigma factor n=1 Tax=Effusibacillus consociatus TaxID=1117041 RepID=A0ABV9Q723_9BACL
MAQWLLSKLMKQDRESERVLFEMFYPRVYTTAHFMTRDPHLAQDIVQETFIKAFKQMHTLKDGEKMGAWLGAIASKTALDFLRKAKKRNDLAIDDAFIENENSIPDFGSPVEEIVEARFVTDMLRQCISELRPEYKQVLMLKYHLGLKDEEIAEALETSPWAVKSRIHRAKLELKVKVTKLAEGGGGDFSDKSLES